MTGNKIAPTGKRRPLLRILGLTIGFLVVVMGIVGALAVLLGDEDRGGETETQRQPPQIRQCDRDSLRQEGRCGGKQ